MEDLFRNSEYWITENDILLLGEGEKIDAKTIKGKRAIVMHPPFRDYLAFSALLIFGVWGIANSWVKTGLSAMLIGVIGIYLSTKRKSDYTLVLWHFDDTTTHLKFGKREDMLEAADAVSEIIIRNELISNS